MKRCAIPALMLWSLALAVAAEPAPSSITVVIKGDDSYPPYSFIQDGRLSGIYTDIIRKVSSRIEKQHPKYAVTILPVPWKRGLQELASGDIFALYPPYYRPKQRPHMGYSVPILSEELAIFCRPGISMSKRNNFPQDFHGLTISKHLGFISETPEAQKSVTQGLLNIVEIPDTRRNLLMLISQRVDCYIGDIRSTLHTYNKMKKEYPRPLPKIQQGPSISQENGYLGISNMVQHYAFKEHFIDLFNGEIESMIKTGEIASIVNKYVASKHPSP